MEKRASCSSPTCGVAIVVARGSYAGHLRSINDLASRARADFVVCTGNFGFFDEESPKHVPDRCLPQRHGLVCRVFSYAASQCGDFPALLRGDFRLSVPVYSVGRLVAVCSCLQVWGSQEDVRVVCRLRSGAYRIPNLFLLDEMSTHKIGNVR
jgi:hypothetical protein